MTSEELRKLNQEICDEVDAGGQAYTVYLWSRVNLIFAELINLAVAENNSLAQINERVSNQGIRLTKLEGSVGVGELRALRARVEALAIDVEEEVGRVIDHKARFTDRVDRVNVETKEIRIVMSKILERLDAIEDQIKGGKWVRENKKTD